MKKFKVLMLAVVVGAVLVGCGDSSSDNATEDSALGGEVEMDLLSGVHTVEMVVEDYGTIVMDLDADIAPISVTNFVGLVEEGFYDGLTFHRIMEGFMIQGGDPLGNGTGGSDEQIKGEFINNGVENTLSHVPGTVSMARAQDMDSASSQFFIVHEDATFLDGEYAAFGTVVDGMDVVNAIATGVPAEDGNGTVAADNQPVITTIKVL